MAVTNRSGADGSGVAFGKQKAYGTPVVDRGPTPVVSNDPVMIPVIFPVSAIGIDGDADVVESNLITAYGSAGPQEIGQEWVDGGWTTRILPEYIHHMLEGILNPITAASVALNNGVATAQQTGNANGALTITNNHHLGDTNGSPTPVGWPSKLQLTLTGSATFSDAKMVIVGKRRGGRRVNSPGTDDRLAQFYQIETVPITSNTTLSTKFWDQVDSVTVSGVTGASNYKLDYVPDGYKTTIQFQATDPRFPGWTVLALKGGIPNRATDYVPSEMSVTASSSGIDVAMSGIGTRYDEFRTISSLAGYYDPKYALESADDTYYSNPPLNSFPGWAGALLFGDEVVKYTTITFGVNRNYVPDEGIDGRKFKYGVSASDNRLVTFSPTSYLRAGDATDVFPKFQELFRNDARYPLTMRNLSYDGDGRQKRMDWTCASSQITAYPRSESTGPGNIERPLEFQALPGTGSVPELIIEIYTETALYT